MNLPSLSWALPAGLPHLDTLPDELFGSFASCRYLVFVRLGTHSVRIIPEHRGFRNVIVNFVSSPKEDHI